MCSSALANFFINKAKEECIIMSNLKLQKLMFIGYGWTLALIDKDLTETEGFEAWQHGPVLPSIYHQMKCYGDTPITKPAMDYDSDENKVYIPIIQDKCVKEILEKVWGIYKSFSAWSLRNLTHETDSPWDSSFERKLMFIHIPEEEVKKYYTKYITALLDEDEDD
ncbi:hypothetical protein BMR07_15580 [Methylococcaceae bacterium CS1]|nr:hypothetical protein BMR07_15580 [Methylococcaceae bacterium CS1]